MFLSLDAARATLQNRCAFAKQAKIRNHDNEEKPPHQKPASRTQTA
jgi:hypothetical protein